MNLKKVMTIGTLVFSLGTFIGVVSYLFRQNLALIELHNKNSDRLLETVTSLRSEIAQYQDLPYFLAQNHIAEGLLTGSIPEQSAENQLNDYLEKINLIAKTSALIIVDTNGLPVANSNWRQQSNHSTVTNNYAGHDLFLQVKNGEAGRQFFSDIEGRSAYYFGAPIHLRQKFIGAAIVRIDVVKLKRQLAFAFDYYVSDKESNLLFASSNTEQNIESKALILALNQRRELTDGLQIVLNFSLPTPHLHQWVELQDLGWQVGLLTPLDQVQSQATAIASISVASYLALVLFTLYLSEKKQKRLSKEKLMQAQLDSEKRQRNIINHAQVGLLTIDNRGSILFANNMFMQQFSVDEEGLFKRKLLGLLTEEAINEVVKQRLIHLDQGCFHPLQGQEANLHRFNGTVAPVLFSIQRMSEHSPTLYLVTIMDITRRKGLEHQLLEVNQSLEQKVEQRTQDLKLAQAELVQAEKLAALGRMSTGIVHELNQPLTAMRNYLAIIRQAQASPELFSENLDHLGGLVDRMASISGQLKSFAYKNTLPLDPIDLVKTLNSLLLLFRTKFEQGSIALTTDINCRTALVLADQTRIEQVFCNLIENACQAMAISTLNSCLQLTLHKSPQGYKFTISDNGPGISEEQKKHLFEPFYTTKPMGTGLGLGLAIVHSIIDDLSGKLLVRDNNPGLTIGFILPAARGD